MFSSARIGCAGRDLPDERQPAGRIALFARSTRISIARGFDGSRRSTPDFSSLARCAWTVDDECRPTALPISRTVGG